METQNPQDLSAEVFSLEPRAAWTSGCCTSSARLRRRQAGPRKGSSNWRRPVKTDRPWNLSAWMTRPRNSFAGRPFEYTRSVPLKAIMVTPRGWSPWLKANLPRFDGVVIHGLWQYHSYGTYRVIRGRAPYAIFPHGMLDPYFKRRFPLKHLRKQMYWLAREYRVLRDAKAVCFTTPIERDCSVHTMWPHRWNPVVVSFGTSAPSGDPSMQRKCFLAQFPQLTGRRFFLFLSRIHIKKGCDLAIEAFARVAADQPDLDLVIAGPDENGLRPRLEAQADALRVAQRVHWTGMLQGDLKWGAIYAAEAFVLPSHQENFGVAAVEAMAAGLPVLLSNKVNIWPDVAGDHAGIVDDDTAEGTYRAMAAFLNMTGEERLRMAENGVRCFRSRYEMKRTAKALNDLF